MTIEELGETSLAVHMGQQAGFDYVPTPCPCCGARTEVEAETMCRPSSDETGERFCVGEFKDGVSVQPTAESIAALDAWVDEQVAKMEADDCKRAEMAALRARAEPK